MLMIPTFIGIVSMVGIFSFLAGYEKAQKEDQEFEDFWEEVKKRVHRNDSL